MEITNIDDLKTETDKLISRIDLLLEAGSEIFSVSDDFHIHLDEARSELSEGSSVLCSKNNLK